MLNKSINFDIKNRMSIKINAPSMTGAIIPILSGGKNTDWANVCKKITINQKRDGSAGTANLDFIMLSDEGAINGKKNSIIPFTPPLGSRVRVYCKCPADMGVYGLNEESLSNINQSIGAFAGDKVCMYDGYIHKITQNSSGEVSITCYDAMVFLKNKVYLILNEASTGASVLQEAFKTIGISNSLGYTIDGSSKFTAYKFRFNGKRAIYNKSVIDVVNWVVGRAAIEGSLGTGPLSDFMVFKIDYNAFSKKIIIKPGSEIIKTTNVVIGPKSGMLDYTMTTSIENNFFNAVQLVFDTGSPYDNYDGLQVITYQEPISVANYGMFIKYENFSYQQLLTGDGLTVMSAQLDLIAQQMVSHYNKPKLSIQVKALGHPKVSAGDVIPIEIPNLKVVSGTEFVGATSILKANDTPYCLIDSVTHNFENGSHTMDFTATVGLESIYVGKVGVPASRVN